MLPRTTTPTPSPSPQGGGECTESPALVLAKSSAILGRKPRSSLAKRRVRHGQTAHRFAAGNLLRQRRASALDCVFVRRINRLSQSARHGESNARMDASPATPSSDQPSNPLPPDVPANPPPETPRRRGLPPGV